LLRSFDFGRQGRFDLGVHTMYETGLEDLDRLLYGIIPEGGWNRLSGVARDFGGAWYAGRLHDNTAYLDLRSNPAHELDRWVASFFSQARWGELGRSSNFMDHFTARFGAAIATEVLAPIVRKFTGVDATDSHRLAGKVVPMERLVLLGEEVVHALMAVPEFRMRVAVPDQRRLPKQWIPSRSAYYPTMYGMQRYVDAFVQRLRDADVKIMTNTDIAHIEGSTVRFSANAGTIDFDGGLFWTTHPYGLAKALDIDMGDLHSDPPRSTVISSFWLNGEPKCRSLYYAFSYDERMKTHRFSCPHYFCPQSTQSGRYRLISELVGESTDTGIDWNARAADELVQMGVIQRDDVCFVRSEVVPGGYPTLSERNIQNIQVMRDRIQQRAPDQVKFLGMLSEEDLFFQTDIMHSIYLKLMG
jgi:protoporphyrinogen oxidase